MTLYSQTHQELKVFDLVQPNYVMETMVDELKLMKHQRHYLEQFKFHPFFKLKQLLLKLFFF